jgi:hypothetical protein
MRLFGPFQKERFRNFPLRARSEVQPVRHHEIPNLASVASSLAGVGRLG